LLMELVVMVVVFIIKCEVLRFSGCEVLRFRSYNLITF